MAETQMNVKLIAHTQLSVDFADEIFRADLENKTDNISEADGRIVSLVAIRTCYSANKPSEIVALEGEKYFGREAKDGEGGTEADRLLRHIFASKHLSVTEHIAYTFAIEGISRACLAQLTRHRVGFSFSVQSQRYVRFGSDDKSGGFDYVVPPKIEADSVAMPTFEETMTLLQQAYDRLRAYGVPPEDARMILPNAAVTNLVMTANLRALLDFYAKRRKGRGAQWEIADLAERLREEVVKVDPWTERFFEQA